MSKPLWLGKDVVGGVPSQQRPDRRPPDHWRLEDVFATARPHHPALSPDRRPNRIRARHRRNHRHLGDRCRRWERSPESRRTEGWSPSGRTAARLWSPDGARIAYNSEGSVHIVPAAGGPSRRLLAGSTGTWIDDDRLAVIVEREGCSRLAVVDIDDPWPAPLGPDNGDVGRAQVAPDGRILLSFYPKDDFSRSDIVIIDPDGSWTTLVGHPDRRAGNHVVDGNRVAYTLEEGDWSGVFLTDLDGGEHTRLAAGERDFSSLTWDNDGQSLLAIATSRGKSDLVRIGLDGTVDLVAEGGTWDSPMPTSQGCRRHPRGIRLAGFDHARWSGWHPFGPLRRRTCRGPLGASLQAGEDHFQLIRRVGDRGIPLPAGRHLESGAGCRLSTWRAHRPLRRRVGWPRPVLRRQGLRLAGYQFPWLDDLRPHLRAGQPWGLGSGAMSRIAWPPPAICQPWAGSTRIASPSSGPVTAPIWPSLRWCTPRTRSPAGRPSTEATSTS